MKKYAVLVAGGNGSRMNSDMPKQFLLLEDKPVLYYTIQTFIESYDDIHIILVLPKDFVSIGEEIVLKYFPLNHIQIVAGGKTRFHSVKNGLAFVKEESVVFVHDAVRCLLSTTLIHRCYEAVLTQFAVVPVISSRDSIRIDNGNENKTIDRTTIKLVQTPQVFLSKVILPAFNAEYNDLFTDEATVLELQGTKIHLIEGEENNLKITHPIDLMVARHILKNK